MKATRRSHCGWRGVLAGLALVFVQANGAGRVEVDHDLADSLRLLLRDVSYTLFDSGDRNTPIVVWIHAAGDTLAAPVSIGPGMTEKSLDAVLKGLAGDDPALRAASVRLLAEFNDSLAWSSAISAFHDTDPEVRAESIYALTDIDAQASANVLRQALADPTENVRLAAIDALGEMGAAQALHDALPTLSPAEQIYLVDAIGDIDNEQSTEILVAVARDAGGPAAAAASEYLSERRQ